MGWVGCQGGWVECEGRQVSCQSRQVDCHLRQIDCPIRQVGWTKGQVKCLRSQVGCTGRRGKWTLGRERGKSGWGGPKRSRVEGQRKLGEVQRMYVRSAYRRVIGADVRRL